MDQIFRSVYALATSRLIFQTSKKITQHLLSQKRYTIPPLSGPSLKIAVLPRADSWVADDSEPEANSMMLQGSGRLSLPFETLRSGKRRRLDGPLTVRHLNGNDRVNPHYRN